MFFETDSGRAHAAEYVEGIRSEQTKLKILRVLELLAESGLLPSNIFKKMAGTGELWEIRVQEHRLLGFHTREHGSGPLEFVIVSAFPKQGQKTPQDEIKVALRRRDAYLSRRGDPQ